jgi:hypothetical protein
MVSVLASLASVHAGQEVFKGVSQELKGDI